MEWKFQKAMNSWTSSQEKNNINLMISVLQKNSNLLIVDLDDKEDHLYFSLSIGSEKESEGEKVPFLNKDSIDSAKKELEDLFDIEKWGNSPRKELFKELQTKILAYFDNLYISPSEKED